MKTQESLADDNLIAIAQRLALSWCQSFATVNESSVGRPEILKKVLAVSEGNARVSTRYFGLGVVCIKINVGENATISVPPADMGFCVAQHKLLTAGTPFFDNQSSMRLRRTLNSVKVQAR